MKRAEFVQRAVLALVPEARQRTYVEGPPAWQQWALGKAQELAKTVARESPFDGETLCILKDCDELVEPRGGSWEPECLCPKHRAEANKREESR